MAKVSSDKQRRRGIYLLPNLFTITALFAGFYAIVASMRGHFETAAIAIFVAMIMDSLDGRVARLTHTESEFGAQLDSLADMVSFGVAPALVIYLWSLDSIGKVGWLGAFVFTVAVALRLARFNTQLGEGGKRYFKGLPCPAGAGVIAGMVWAASDLGMRGDTLSWVVMFITVSVGLLMVSNIRYRSFKDLDLKGTVSFVAILVVVLILVLVALDPPQLLFAIFFLYALSGPVAFLWQGKRRARLNKLLHIRKRKKDKK